ncbi:fumarylacetoacetate hydrolase FahA [Tothia fuscella]|uniref:Fumarylacetoacetase n=1 Tax=Tothia fuscella TaxID=1048955 RepID=A0A9P4NN57_9PEZI|nr:fumarylacetoacetate hydrolase FahA [Tothia fuscella]
MAFLKSWFPIPSGSHFSLANIPFGIISTESSPKPRVGVAIGDHALDLQAFAKHNGFSALSTIQPFQAVFSELNLNAFAALGRPVHSVVRKYIQSIFAADTVHPDVLKDKPELQKLALIPLKDVINHIPFKIGDYTDFYSGLNHAVNCSRILRGIGGLQPNYKQLPVGYHGRASSVVVSGTPIKRPSGQILETPQAKAPIFSACRKLDFELELGCFVCKPNDMGDPVLIDKAEENLFGVVLMNDWSARDIQSWEMVPLGPFNAKNFGTSISAWVVTMDALEPFLTQGIENDQEILSYLREPRKENVYDIKLNVDLKTNSGKSKTICKTSAKNLLFSFPQMLAHHTVGGCPFNVGDLMGSGTISGKDDRDSYGALLEQTENGQIPIKFDSGEERTFLLDGDTITFTGVCGNDPEQLVGFGECSGMILPAVKF